MAEEQANFDNGNEPLGGEAPVNDLGAPPPGDMAGGPMDGMPPTGDMGAPPPGDMAGGPMDGMPPMGDADGGLAALGDALGGGAPGMPGNDIPMDGTDAAIGAAIDSAMDQGGAPNEQAGQGGPFDEGVAAVTEGSEPEAADEPKVDIG